MHTLAKMNVTVEQFEAVLDTDMLEFDELLTALAFIANSADLIRQLLESRTPLEAACHHVPVLDYDFNDKHLDTARAFDKYYDVAEFERIMDRIAECILPDSLQVEAAHDIAIRNDIICMLATRGIPVSVNFESGLMPSDDDEDQIINLDVTFDFGNFKLRVG